MRENFRFKSFDIYTLGVNPKYILLPTELSLFYLFHQRKTLKIMKNAFYFTERAPFVLEIFKFWYFPVLLFLPHSAIVEFTGKAN